MSTLKIKNQESVFFSRLQEKTYRTHRLFLKDFQYLGISLHPDYFNNNLHRFSNPEVIIYRFKDYFNSDQNLALCTLPSNKISNLLNNQNSNIWLQISPINITKSACYLINEAIFYVKSLSHKGIGYNFSQKFPTYPIDSKQDLSLDLLIKTSNSNFKFPGQIYDHFNNFCNLIKSISRNFLECKIGVHPYFIAISIKISDNQDKKLCLELTEKFPLCCNWNDLPLTYISDLSLKKTNEFYFIIHLNNLGNTFSRKNFKNSHIILMPSSTNKSD